MKYLVVLDLEPKEDDSGVFPRSEDVRQRLRDILVDVTKHDETIGWRVTAVNGLRQTMPDVIL